MKKYISLILILCFQGGAFAQMERPYIPGSPNAAALARSANIDVGYYSGTPGVSIPFHNLSGRDISVPISINYNGAGVKVQDVASSVGLGWNLNAGGAITRVVRGKPDGSKPNCSAETTGRITKPGMWDVYLNACDGERDIFYFSMLGRVGKMYLDDAGKAQTMPYADLEISTGVGSASIGYWKVVDEIGYIYYFGETAASREDTRYYIWDTQTSSYVEKETYTSTWYLNKIVSPKGIEVATFTYLSGSDVTYEMFGQQGIGCGTGATVKRTDAKIQILQAKYISQIATITSSASFSYSNRIDVGVTGSQVLNSVSFKDNSNAVIKKVYLGTDYFLCDYGLIPNCRLRLSSISEGVNTPIVTHSFVYNEISTPGGNRNPTRDSYWADYWGYYNFTQTTAPTNRLENQPAGCDGSSKLSDPIAAQTYILKEINYATGNTTAFEYELHVYSKPSSTWTANFSGGGLRVKSITNKIGATQIAKSTFTYSSGQAYDDPLLYYTNSAGQTIRSSNSYKNIFDINGAFVGYSSVAETFLDGSKIVRTFYNSSDPGRSDEAPIVGKYEGGTNLTYVGGSNVDGSPFASYSSNAWLRGLSKSIEIRDNLSNLLSLQEFAYQPGSLLNTTWNTAVEAYKTIPGNHGFYVGEYMLRSQPVYLNNTTSYVYDQTDLNKVRAETTTYTYHATHKTFPETIINYVQGGNLYEKTFFRYPIDLTGTGAEPSSPSELAGGLWALVKAHVITALEKTLYYLDGDVDSQYKIVGAELLTFRKNTVTTKPLLKGLYRLDLNDAGASFTAASLTSGGTVFNFDAKYRLMQNYNYTESTSNISSVGDAQGLVTGYDWGYNNSFVTAEYSTLGSVDYRTQYSYNTINGLLNKTDMNNRVSRYEYDNYGRLKMIKDHDYNILARSRYNIKSVNEFGIDLVLSNDPGTTSQIITFTSANETQTIGTTKYIWDFGDGQVVENANSSTTHSYSSPGTYVVKLAKVNSEYGTVITSKSLVIQ